MSEEKATKEKKRVAYEVTPCDNVELVHNKGLQRVEYCVFGDYGKFAFHKELETEEFVYRPPIIIEEMAKKNFMFLPSQPEEYGNDTELADAIYAFLYKYADYADEYRKLDVWYAKFTWVFDLFSTLPYRRALGDTGRGKTRWATVLGSICRMAYFQGAATTSAPIYRLSDLIRGTMIIDENYFSTKTETGQAIIAILNSGYSKTTGFVMRCIGDSYTPAFFVTYGPKLVAARFPFPDEATENRTISHFAYETDKESIPIHLGDEFWAESLKLRNMLLLWRFRNRKNHVVEDGDFLHLKINPRLKEVLYPLSTIIQDPKVKASLKSLAENLNHNLLEVRGSSNEGIVLSAILSLISEQKNMAIKTISDRIKELEPEFEFYDVVKPRKLGWFCRTRLGLKVERVYDKEKNTNPYTVVFDGDLEKILRLAKQYGINEETIRSITSLTTITEEERGDGENKLSQNDSLHPCPTVIDIKDVIEIIEWLKETTQQGKDAPNISILYSCVGKKFDGNLEKSLALLNWLTSKRVIAIGEQTFSLSLLSTIFLEASIQRRLSREILERG